MPNIEGIIAKLCEDCCQANRNGDELCLYPITYGDARQIIAEVARLTAERDAAVSKLNAYCLYCGKVDRKNGGECK